MSLQEFLIPYNMYKQKDKLYLLLRIECKVLLRSFVLIDEMLKLGYKKAIS